jgi:hypothetical protein
MATLRREAKRLAKEVRQCGRSRSSAPAPRNRNRASGLYPKRWAVSWLFQDHPQPRHTTESPSLVDTPEPSGGDIGADARVKETPLPAASVLIQNSRVSDFPEDMIVSKVHLTTYTSHVMGLASIHGHLTGSHRLYGFGRGVLANPTRLVSDPVSDLRFGR